MISLEKASKIKLLFFTPYAGRTGSEMFLWYMFHSINKGAIEANLVSECNGELLAQMPKEIKTYVSLKYPNRATRLKQMAAGKFGVNLYEKHIIDIHKKIKPDYWYLNTVQMADKISLARKNNIPVIMHIHELTTDYALVTKTQLQSAIDYATLFIVNSKAVYNSLEVLGAKNIILQYPCIDISKIKPDDTNSRKLKEELELTKFDFVWLMSGTSNTRKGIDMIPELAKLLKEQNAAIVWLGNSSNTGMDLMIERQIVYAKLNNVFFLGKKTEDYYDYMNLMDGFILTSREEPFGMVVLEALALGKPVVSFNSGGVSEIITNETGRIVNSRNVADLAADMKGVATDKNKFNPERAKERANDFDVKNQVKNWETILFSLAK